MKIINENTVLWRGKEFVLPEGYLTTEIIDTFIDDNMETNLSIDLDAPYIELSFKDKECLYIAHGRIYTNTEINTLYPPFFLF